MIADSLPLSYLLLENYKKMFISEEELAVILMIDHLINQKNSFINADLLSLKMSLEKKKIDSILSSLLIKGFIEYTTRGKKTITSLEPIKRKLSRQLQLSLSNEEERRVDKNIKNELSTLYATFEETLGRSLAPVEKSKIKEWVCKGYTVETITNALTEVIKEGKHSMVDVDSKLISFTNRDDFQAEGHSCASSSWNKSLEETIRIAKTPWLDDDDKK